MCCLVGCLLVYVFVWLVVLSWCLVCLLVPLGLGLLALVCWFELVGMLLGGWLGCVTRINHYAFYENRLESMKLPKGNLLDASVSVGDFVSLSFTNCCLMCCDFVSYVYGPGLIQKLSRIILCLRDMFCPAARTRFRSA